jgi:hypothetical protein
LARQKERLTMYNQPTPRNYNRTSPRLDRLKRDGSRICRRSVWDGVTLEPRQGAERGKVSTCLPIRITQLAAGPVALWQDQHPRTRAKLEALGYGPVDLAVLVYHERNTAHQAPGVGGLAFSIVRLLVLDVPDLTNEPAGLILHFCGTLSGVDGRGYAARFQLRGAITFDRMRTLWSVLGPTEKGWLKAQGLGGAGMAAKVINMLEKFPPAAGAPAELVLYWNGQRRRMDYYVSLVS